MSHEGIAQAPDRSGGGGALHEPIAVEAVFAEAAAHHRAGRLAEAETLYRQVLAIDPAHAESLHLLGVAALQSGRPTDAVELISQAVALRNDDPYFHANLGNALAALGKLADAAAHLRRALLLKPDLSQAYSDLGCILLDQGQLDAAQRAQEHAIRLQPDNALFYRRLLHGRHVTVGDPYLGAMEALARNSAALPPAEQRELHFALGKAYGDIGQYERSFRHYQEGNALKRREFVYEERGMLGFLDRIRTVFSADLLSSRRGLGDPSAAPVFIVGMPRSGTTLVEQILASHPQVFAAGELELLLAAAVNLHSPAQPALAFPEAVPALSDEALRGFGASYVDSVRALGAHTERFTDKMPANAGLVGLIHLTLPNARIIHVRRDPLDTCLSCFTVLFESGQPYSYELAELGRYYRAHTALMEHWARVLPAGTMLEVCYEDLVADVEAGSRRIVSYCGLEWDAACAGFYRTQRPVRTASAYQVRQPIYRTSVGRWRNYQEFLRPLIDELGALGETGGAST